MSRQFARHARRIACILLAVLLAFELTFGASIVSPADCSIAYSDSLLVSVKLSDQKTVRITVYKEQTGAEKEVRKEDGSIVIETEYTDADASGLTENDLAAIAAGKKTEEDGSLIVLSTGDAIPDYHDAVFAPAVEYTNSTAGIGFYTKKIVNVTPGLYKVKVETLGNKNEVIETALSYAAVKEKKEEKQGIFGRGVTSGPLQFLQNLLKNLFNR